MQSLPTQCQDQDSLPPHEEGYMAPSIYSSCSEDWQPNIVSGFSIFHSSGNMIPMVPLDEEVTRLSLIIGSYHLFSLNTDISLFIKQR